MIYPREWCSKEKWFESTPQGALPQRSQGKRQGAQVPSTACIGSRCSPTHSGRDDNGGWLLRF
jgi:hypothetical protein